MQGFHIDIEKETLANNNFRKVLYTAKHSQLVLMNLQPGEEIGAEVHNELDQFFRIEAGTGKAVIDDNEYTLADGVALIVPAGANHNVMNTGDEALKLYTIYSPPEHRDGVLQETKAAAEAEDEHFDGKTTE